MPGKLQNHRFIGVRIRWVGRELDLERILRKLRPADRDSRKVADQWNPVFCSTGAGNLQLKSVMRSIPMLRNEPEAGAYGAVRRRQVRIGNPEVITHPDANDGAVGSYRHED